MRKISIGIDSWIIQDGNYGDFAVGNIAKFALEFAGSDLVPCVPGERSAELLHTSVYRIRAQVIFLRPTLWVIDFGVPAYLEKAPPVGVEVGSWVEGEIFLGIDPFFYTAYLRDLPRMPDLYDHWIVTGISRDDTPWLSNTNERGGITLSRDVERVKWTEVKRTRAWDDGRRASYVLRCRIEP